MLNEIKGETLKAVRDRALLSFGMVSRMRRFKIAAQPPPGARGPVHPKNPCC